MSKTTRKMDELGRVVLPIGMRTALTLQIGDALDLSCNGETISLKKSIPAIHCDCCKEEIENLSKIENLNLCPKCIAKIKNG